MDRPVSEADVLKFTTSPIGFLWRSALSEGYALCVEHVRAPCGQFRLFVGRLSIIDRRAEIAVYKEEIQLPVLIDEDCLYAWIERGRTLLARELSQRQ